VILNELVQGKNVGYCASVCREWQRVIERHNFHSLKITSSSLAQFSIMATRNLKLIKYIWYCIKLQEYDCTQCFWSESLGDIYANRKILGNGLRDIFVALRRRPLKGELTLDISVYSPSDSLHYFKDISFEPANGLPPTQLRTIKKILATHDPEHGWNHGYMTVLPSDEALDRLFSDFDFPDNFWRTVPRVPAVTILLLRRQNRRRWDCVQLIPLFRRLPNLQEICYEPWRQWIQKPNQSYQDNCKCSKSQPELSESLLMLWLHRFSTTVQVSHIEQVEENDDFRRLARTISLAQRSPRPRTYPNSMSRRDRSTCRSQSEPRTFFCGFHSGCGPFLESTPITLGVEKARVTQPYVSRVSARWKS
jgi:hypothetical protein